MNLATGINIKKFPWENTERTLEPMRKTEFRSLEERKWRLSYLKEQFESNQLHRLYEKFIRKVNHGYFSLFLIVQTIMSLTHFLIVLFTNYKSKEQLIIVSPDLILYFITLILSLFALSVVDRIAEKSKKLHYLAMFAFILILFENSFVPIYHATAHVKYRPAYTSYLILSCYIFFGINNLIVCFIMGLSVTIFAIITLLLASYERDDFLWKKVLSDFFSLGCFNAVGIYFRYLNEINVRRSFLDRRDYIMSTHQLRHEQFQVEQLMSSIIPQYIIDKVKQNYIEATKYQLNHNKHLQRNPFDTSLLDEHKNVSILFADIVHYTEMTIQLNITELLETLNELFSSFDETSEKFQVTRIKFLGDCYYCVAGLPPTPAKNHAEACVDLGLAMIEIIDRIRRKRNLNVNMRIGIHTGNIISGVIGSVKYQYDIWSKDVDIANKMESEGVPGKVHITNKTQELLKKRYSIKQTTKGETVLQFKQNNLQTFLVSPHDTESVIYQNRSLMYKKQKSVTISILTHLQRLEIPHEEDENSLSDARDSVTDIVENGTDEVNSNVSTYRRRYASNSQRPSKADDSRRSTSEVKRRTAFMNNNLKRYIERAHAVNAEMDDSIQGISFSKYNQYFRKIQDVSVLLLFNNLKDEFEYITMPDPLFKYYLIAALLTVFCNYLLQNLTLGSWDRILIKNTLYGTTIFLIVFIFIPLAFTKYFWDKYFTKYANQVPPNRFVKCMYKSSEFISDNFIARVSIYTVIYALSVLCFLSEAVECANNIQEWKQSNETTDYGLTKKYPNCVFPWEMTQSCILVLLTTFVFLRMFLWLKILYALIIIIIQIQGVQRYTREFYENSETFNVSLHPQIAHLLEISLLTFAIHTLDRQTDYMNRLTHMLNKKVELEQQEADKLQGVSRNLLLNILPKHVANLYLDVNREMKDLYYEEHHDTAIMFASIITNDLQDTLDETRFLSLMNEYIMAFDTLINREEFKTIEKIKIAKWTYLAACGLFPDNQSKEFERCITKSSLETILQFVSKMYKKLNSVNKEYFQECKLRVGICHGSILAGVVGSKKPLYDIWGDPVNMASRMDSTGVANCIQVKEDTAEIINRLGYLCEYRGEIFIKGKEGLTKTYFVKLDDEFNLVKRKSMENLDDSEFD